MAVRRGRRRLQVADQASPRQCLVRLHHPALLVALTALSRRRGLLELACSVREVQLWHLVLSRRAPARPTCSSSARRSRPRVAGFSRLLLSGLACRARSTNDKRELAAGDLVERVPEQRRRSSAPRPAPGGTKRLGGNSSVSVSPSSAAGCASASIAAIGHPDALLDRRQHRRGATPPGAARARRRMRRRGPASSERLGAASERQRSSGVGASSLAAGAGLPLLQSRRAERPPTRARGRTPAASPSRARARAAAAGRRPGACPRRATCSRSISRTTVAGRAGSPARAAARAPRRSRAACPAPRPCAGRASGGAGARAGR